MRGAVRIRLTGRAAVTRSGTTLPRLIVMTRYPAPGRTKMRLASHLGERRAAELASEIALHCIRRLHAVSLSEAVDLEIRYTGASAAKMRSWIGRRVAMSAQSDGDLGKRLERAMREAFEAGAPVAIAVGSDAPSVGGTQIRAALVALESNGVVLGPATDGGYYLVGVRSDASRVALPALFDAGVSWGTEAVFSETAASLGRVGITASTLETLPDVDRPEDVVLWQEMRAEEERARISPEISVVIPALNEQERITHAVESAHAAGIRDVVVADGGSADDTPALARASGAAVIAAPRGRSSQLNAGAAHATGDVLVFLHADCRLPADAAAQIRGVLGDPDVALGAFRFEAGDRTDFVDRLITAAGQLRHRVFALPYGDQALFMRRVDFEDLGGFPDIPVMEDHELASRCRRLGALGTASSSVRSSTRSWRDHGVVAWTLVNMAVIGGYRLRLSLGRLASWRGMVLARRRSTR